MNRNLEEALQYYRTQGAPGDQNALTNLLREGLRNGTLDPFRRKIIAYYATKIFLHLPLTL